MATIQKFEDIIAWQESRILCKEIYALLKSNRDYGYCDQIQRVAVSIMNNIAEGFERKSDKEMKQFLYISKGSAGEVRSMLMLGLDLGYFSKVDTEKLIIKTTKISGLLAGFIKTL